MFTELQSQILAILIENPQKEFYFSQLGQILGRHPGVFQKGLNSLEKEGIISSRRQGNQRLLRVNCAHPFFEEVKSIIKKSYGIEGLVREIVKHIKEIRIALIYGSYPSGKMRVDSDVDLLVVLSDLKAEDALMNRLSEAEKKVGREINYKMYSMTEFSRKLAEKDPFLTEILSERIILIKGKIE
ncbi:MAG: nucleotidyltransferase domain-containing protein [Candidatus Omnitrophica bacterium]|nr:nucleotidyltransferase domain-containing protein [Candidatus Omnitrophota bacterium]